LNGDSFKHLSATRLIPSELTSTIAILAPVLENQTTVASPIPDADPINGHKMQNN